jgi:hypothetical protein
MLLPAFNRLVQYATACAQERYLESYIKRTYKFQTARTVCRLPRIYKMREARNVRQFTFEQYLLTQAAEDQQALRLTLALDEAITGERACVEARGRVGRVDGVVTVAGCARDPSESATSGLSAVGAGCPIKGRY